MPADGSAYVLDSFALLAYFQGEPGTARVRSLLAKAARDAIVLHLSIINLGEVLHTVEREQGQVSAQRTLAALDQLPIVVQPADRTIVLSAARLKARYAISYADAFAVVAAQKTQAILLSADPELGPLAADGVLQVEWLPRR